MLVSGIFLEAGGAKRPPPEQWKAGYDLLAAELRRHSVEPEYDMIDNFKGSLKLRRIAARSEEVTTAEFRDTETIALVAAPSKSRRPAHEWFAQCGIVFREGNYRRLTLTFLIASQYCSLGSPAFEETLLAASKFFDCDFGWGMARDKEKGIELYLSGDGVGDGFTAEDRRRTNAWYGAYSPEERRARLRDVFPYNIVGSGHLSQLLPDGRALREFITEHPGSTLQTLGDERWLWRVQPEWIEDVRANLLGSRLVVSE